MPVFEKFGLSLNGIPEPPCKRCRHEQRCRTWRLACYNFAGYCGARVTLTNTIHRKQPKVPHRAVYRVIFPEEQL